MSLVAALIMLLILKRLMLHNTSSGMSTVDELDPAAHPPGGVFIEGEPLNNPAEGPLFVWLFALAVVAAVDFSVVLPTQYDYIKKVG